MKKEDIENFNKWLNFWPKVSRKSNANQNSYWDIIKEWSEIWIKEWCHMVAIEYTLGPVVNLTAPASSSTPFCIRQRAWAKTPNFISLVGRLHIPKSNQISIFFPHTPKIVILSERPITQTWMLKNWSCIWLWYFFSSHFAFPLHLNSKLIQKGCPIFFF